MDKLKYKYVIEIHRSKEDGGDLCNIPMLFGNEIDIDFLFRNHPEMKSITFKRKKGQVDDKD